MQTNGTGIAKVSRLEILKDRRQGIFARIKNLTEEETKLRRELSEVDELIRKERLKGNE